MKFKQFSDRYFLRIDKREEIVETFKKFCYDSGIKAGFFQGIGSSNKLTIGCYNTGEKNFYKKDFEGEYEITNISGNISTFNGETYIHMHTNFSGTDYISYGDHLNSEVVSGTYEMAVIRSDGKIERVFDEDTGLNIYLF